MDDEKVKVDAIVVGGGPAGLAAAHTMAQKEMEVILVERGEYAGSKNVGGLLYGTVLNEMIPKFYQEAPVERSVVKRQIVFLGEKEHSALTFGSSEWGQEPYNYTYTVHRSQFDRWFSGKVEDAGASLLEGMVVDNLIYEGEGAERRAVGVKIRGDEVFYADTIILCDGTHCLVTDGVREELNLTPGAQPQHYAVGVKETYGLDKKVIEDRFGLNDGEGMAIDFIGVPFEGLVGGGFIYTQKETISLGFAAKLETLTRSGLTPNDIINQFKQHPVVANYLRGGELLEYSAHLLPEAGYDAISQIAGNGVMICGDAAGLVNMSLYKEGTNHAMESGRCAGQVAAAARESGDFSHAGLRAYEEQMRQGVAFADLKKYKDLPQILDTTPGLLSLYPAKATRMLVDYFTMSYEPKKAIQKRAFRQFLKGLPKFRFVRDLIRARKVM